ncbi:hypothetical protein BDW02DRAFT_295542 [Decorospora gaudefroyi]|uniref:Uncharacterized protein n=1 Tax=Decorospora gaudefroyi TaxID=184978 RepID=A0A6A5KBD4_9PLEO|nr:hypothetical protein BDW02DRAFT_295542 [Decorospora gaudefroyi]
MSGPDQPELIVETTRTLKRKHLSADAQDDLHSLDHIFKRIKTAVPRTPYILSTPSLHPYRYHSQQQANAWMIGRLWRHDEEHVQYRTYLYREPCQDCFELQAGEDDEPEPERPRSQPSHGQPAKKKPNLSAFKVKHANGTITPGTKVAEPNLGPAKHLPGQTNGAKSEKPSSPAGKALLKSPKPSSDAPRDERRAVKATQVTPHSQTRPRPSSSSQKSETASSKATTEKSGPSNSTPHGLPPLLSPVHQPLGNPHGLPSILSPTLPSNIQAELDRLEVQRKRAQSDASTSSSDRKSQTLAVPPAASQKPNGAPKVENRIRSVLTNGKSPNPEPVSHAEVNDASMVVKLKFSKTKAPVVGQILRLPAKRGNAEKSERHDTPKATLTEARPKVTDPPVIKKKPIPKIAARRGEGTTPVPTSTPAASTKPAHANIRVAEKRPRTDDDASLAVPAAKRPKASSTQDRPVTPVQQTTSPAQSSQSSAQRGQTQYATPKKTIKSVTMLRSQSAESYDATPGRSGATPAGVKLESKSGPTSVPLNNKKQADISLLGQTSAKLNQMGRALKHEATKILTSAGAKITKQDEKRAAVTNLECILAYMAAYSAQDLSLNLRGRAGEVEQTWKTLLPLCLSYSRCTRDFQHLDGLRSYLSSIIAAAICTHVSQRGSATKSHDSPQDTNSNHVDAAKLNNSMADNYALLADHTLKMNRHFQDARIALPLEELQTSYKKTYAARETNIKLAREPEKVSGARMSGPYFLPLGPDTTPIQAVRFGLKFLAEYCEREGLVYALRVLLDRVE